MRTRIITLAILGLLLGQVPAEAVSCADDACVVEDVGEEYPFMVALQFDIGDSGSICTGSLISLGDEDEGTPAWVLTAAHCCVDSETLEVDPDVLVEIAFAPDSRVDEDAQRVTLDASNVFPNPNYDGGNNDICLLNFDPGEIDMSVLDYIDVVSAGSDPSDFDYKMVQVMGYGTTGNEDEDNYGDFLFRTLTLETKPCSESQFQNDIICTEDLDVGDVCAGDSGGPLLLPWIIDNQPRFLQIAIVSRGPDCADRINDPEASEQERGEGMEGTWNFIPYQSDFLCETAEICDYVIDQEWEEEGEEDSNEE